jgi:lysine-specific histone demethylase 1B
VLNCQAKNIQYNGEKVTVTNQNGQEYEATHVILTVPITVLKEGDITFNPPLPLEKTQAFQKIGMDAGMKVFLKFSEQFYDDNIVGGKVCAAYANEKVGKTGVDHVLLAFIMGEQAEALTNLEDSEIVNKLLAELDEMYVGKASATFVSAYVQDWSKHPFIRGAYSYSPVGMGDVRKIAAASVESKLYFAGEAMHLAGHHQTVQGAAESAYFSLAEMLEGFI